MNTAVLERNVSQKTWNRTRGFEELKPQVKVEYKETIPNENWDDYELADDVAKELEEIMEDIKRGNTIRLHTPIHLR
jgi:hypothetical protein